MSILKPKVEITIANRTILKIIAIILVAMLGLRAVIALAHPITLILIAFFLALALNPAVTWVSKRLKHKNRALATGIAFSGVLITLATFFSLVIPPLVSQVTEFIKDVPATVENVKTQDSAIGRAIRRYELDKQVDQFSRDFSKRIGPKPVIDTASRVGGVFVSILAVLAMTFMMLNEGPRWLDRLLMLIPASKREYKRKLIGKMYSMVTGYVTGQVIMSAIAASFLLIALVVISSLMNVSINAVALAGIAAFFGLIPMIGNPITAFIVVSACLLTSPNMALVVLIYFIVYGQLENITLQPYIQSRQNELTPLTVFVAALLGISYAGIIGALFAIPVAGCLKILFVDWGSERGYLANQKSETKE